jgi:hypothetical protein
MKKFVGLMLVILFLLLDYAALDDITTGNEPNFYGEYAFLLASVPLLILVSKWAFGKNSKTV